MIMKTEKDKGDNKNFIKLAQDCGRVDFSLCLTNLLQKVQIHDK